MNRTTNLLPAKYLLLRRGDSFRLRMIYCIYEYLCFQAFLKRLESVKPTPGMTRDEQLADYQRQSRYLGTHVTALPPVKLKSNKTSGTCTHTHNTNLSQSLHEALWMKTCSVVCMSSLLHQPIFSCVLQIPEIINWVGL